MGKALLRYLLLSFLLAAYREPISPAEVSPRCCPVNKTHGFLFKFQPSRALIKLGSVEYLIVAQQQLRPHKQQRHSKQISSTAQRYSFCDAIIRTSGPSKHIVLETRTGDNSAQSVSNTPTTNGRGVVARIRRYRMMIRSNNSAHFLWVLQQKQIADL